MDMFMVWFCFWTFCHSSSSVSAALNLEMRRELELRCRLRWFSNCVALGLRLSSIRVGATVCFS